MDMLDVPGGRVWHRIAGAETGVPARTPRRPWRHARYLNSLAPRWRDERPVIFYDQLGAASDKPEPRSGPSSATPPSSGKSARSGSSGSISWVSWGRWWWSTISDRGIGASADTAAPASAPRWAADQWAHLAEMPAAVRTRCAPPNLGRLAKAYQDAMLLYYRARLPARSLARACPALLRPDEHGGLRPDVGPASSVSGAQDLRARRVPQGSSSGPLHAGRHDGPRPRIAHYRDSLPGSGSTSSRTPRTAISSAGARFPNAARLAPLR